MESKLKHQDQRLISIRDEHHSNTTLDLIFNMYEEKQLTDLILSGDDKTEIHCHSTIVCASSPFLKAHTLQVQAGGGGGGIRFVISGFSHKILKPYVDFAYRGSLYIEQSEVNVLKYLATQLGDDKLNGAIERSVSEEKWNANDQIMETGNVSFISQERESVQKVQDLSQEYLNMSPDISIDGEKYQNVSQASLTDGEKHLNISYESEKDGEKHLNMSQESEKDQEKHLNISQDSLTDGEKHPKMLHLCVEDGEIHMNMSQDTEIDKSHQTIATTTISQDIDDQTSRRLQEADMNESFQGGNRELLSVKEEQLTPDFSHIKKSKEQRQSSPEKCPETENKQQESVTKKCSKRLLLEVKDKSCTKEGVEIPVKRKRGRPPKASKMDKQDTDGRMKVAISSNERLEKPKRKASINRRVKMEEDIETLAEDMVKVSTEPSSNSAWFLRNDSVCCTLCKLIMCEHRTTFISPEELQHSIDAENSSVKKLTETVDTEDEDSYQLETKSHVLEWTGRNGKSKKLYPCKCCFAYCIGEASHRKHLAYAKKPNLSIERCLMCVSVFNNKLELRKHQVVSHATFKTRGDASIESERSFTLIEDVEQDADAINETGDLTMDQSAISISKLYQSSLDERFLHSPHQGVELFWKCEHCKKVICRHRTTRMTPAEVKYCVDQTGMMLQDAEVPNFESESIDRVMTDGQKVTLKKYKQVLCTPCKKLIDPEDGAWRILYPCPHCDYYIVGGFKQLMLHLPNHGVELPPVKCAFCMKSYSSTETLRKHDKRIHQSKNKVGEGKGDYQCQQCFVFFKAEESLDAHMDNHDTDLVAIRHLSELKYPYVNRYDPKTKRFKKCYSCEICGKEANDANTFEIHMSGHGYRPYLCNLCPERFGYMSKLQDHLRKHIGKHTSTCSKCGKSFVTKAEMQHHMAYAHSNKEYACDLCKNVYKQSSHLKSHVQRVHATSILPKGETSDFQCFSCGKFVHNKWILEAHRWGHEHDGLHLKCRYCDMRFKYHNMRIAHEKNCQIVTLSDKDLQ